MVEEEYDYYPEYPENYSISTVVKRGSQWFVVSKDGSKVLAGPYATRQEAGDRLRQIETFKHMKNK